MKSIRRRGIRAVLIALLWLLLWQGAAMLIGKPLYLPSPVQTAESLARLVGTAAFWATIGVSLLRVAAGFVLGIVTGSALGVLTALSDTADAVLSPIRSLVKATPVTSFILLVLLWLTKSVTPVFIAFLMVVPIAWANVRASIKAVDTELLQMARVFKLDRKTVVRHIYVPCAMPGFVAACSTGLGFAWKSGVAAEVIATPALSIGRSIYESKLYLEIPELFAWTAAVIMLSVLLEHLMLFALRRVKS